MPLRQSKSLIACGLSATLALLSLHPAQADQLTGVDLQHFVENIRAAGSLARGKDWDKCREKFNEALELAINGGDERKIVSVNLKIGESFRDQGNYSAAEEVFKKTLPKAEGRTAPEETQICTCLYNLADALVKQKKDAEARPIFARCIEMSKGIFTANNPILAVRKGEYAALLTRLGEKDEAEKLNRESQAVIDEFMTDMSKKIKTAWHQPPEKFSYRIAVSYDVLNHGKVRGIEVTKSSGSEIADRAAMDAVKNGAPFLDIDSKDPLEMFGMAFTFDFNYHKRRPDTPAGAAIPGQSASTGGGNSNHPSRQVKEETEAKLKAEKHKSDELREKIDKALEAKPENAGDLAALADMYAQYAESVAVQGHYEDGVDKLSEALGKSCFKKAGDPSRVSLMISLAHIHLYADDAAKAEPILKDATSQAGFPNVPAKLRQLAYEDYGNCLTKEKRFAEAQDYFNKAREIKE